MSLLTIELMKEQAKDKRNVISIFELDGKSLRVCPFCYSGEITVRQEDETECFWCHCLKCQAEGPIAGSRRGAIQVWQKGW